MKAFQNVFVQSFLDDMAETVGVKKWAMWTFIMALLTYGLWGTNIIPYIGIIGLILTINLGFAFVVSAWWKFYGKQKYQTGSILDIAQLKQRDNE